MVYSAEIRWFVPGSLPPEILDWFKSKYEVKDDNGKQINSFESEKSRDDYYLLFPECDSVGVKLREIPEKEKTNFEIKALLCPPRPFVINKTVSGKTDQWVKWSSSNLELPNIKTGSKQTDEQWIKVTKTRFLRKFSINDGEVKEVWSKTKSLPNAGCNVELTGIEIETEPRQWFSVGFEAFGTPAKIHSILNDTVLLFFQKMGQIPKEKLNTFNSLNYPAWLITLEFNF